jgi:hypothetical protein
VRFKRARSLFPACVFYATLPFRSLGSPFGASLGARGNARREISESRKFSLTRIRLTATNRNEESENTKRRSELRARMRELFLDLIRRNEIDSISPSMSILFGRRRTSARTHARTHARTQVCRARGFHEQTMDAFFLGSREHKDATRLSFAPVSFRFHVPRRAILSYLTQSAAFVGRPSPRIIATFPRGGHKRSGGSRSTCSYFELPVCAYDCRVQPVIIIPR